jgi:hypothetical protein
MIDIWNEASKNEETIYYWELNDLILESELLMFWKRSSRSDFGHLVYAKYKTRDETSEDIQQV